MNHWSDDKSNIEKRERTKKDKIKANKPKLFQPQNQNNHLFILPPPPFINRSVGSR